MTQSPLTGRRILVTRPESRGHGLAARLRALGAVVEEHPAIAFEPPVDTDAVARTLRSLSRYAVIFFTSPTGVAQFTAARARHAPAEVALPAAAVGAATAKALADAGVAAVVVAEEPTAAGLAAAARTLALAGRDVLVVRPETSSRTLEDALTAMGARVDAVAFYRTVPAPARDEAARGLAAGAFDAVVFASPSALVALLGSSAVPSARLREALARTRRIAIGPVTRAALAAEGLPAAAVAAAPDDDAIAHAVIAALQPA